MVLRTLFALVTAAPILCLSACQSAPVTEELGPPFSLSTPRNTVEYFRESVLRNSPANEFRCFSEAMKREFGMGYGEYTLVREDLREELENLYGKIEHIRVVEEREVVPDQRVELMVRGRTRAEVVTLVRETWWEVTPVDNSQDTVYADVNGMQAVLAAESRELVARLPLRDGPPIAPADIHKVVIRSDWKFYWQKTGRVKLELERLRKVPAEAGNTEQGKGTKDIHP